MAEKVTTPEVENGFTSATNGLHASGNLEQNNGLPLTPSGIESTDCTNNNGGTPCTPNKHPSPTSSESVIALNKVPVPSKPTLFPKLFERAQWSPMGPQFDNPELENYVNESFFHQTNRNFRLALVFIGISCLAWAIFFAAIQCQDWKGHLAGSVALLAFTVATIVITWFPVYKDHYYIVSGFYVSLLLLVLIISPFYYAVSGAAGSSPDPTWLTPGMPPIMSPLASFSFSMQLILLIYTLIPFPLYIAIIMALICSFALESPLLVLLSQVSGSASEFTIAHICGKVALHICTHFLGIYIFFMGSVRKHSMFWTIGQSTLSRGELRMEKHLTDDMIKSLMPPRVAHQVITKKTEGTSPADRDECDSIIVAGTSGSSSRPKKNNDLPVMFQQFFWMEQMKDVSILFADIVGFTKMSSNKTAEHLVTLLNNLFARFDTLCTQSGCEKISTLGDCYYCVSGCPDPRPDHARCCVEMGLSMIEAIKEFDIEYNEDVNMRVGVHTGKVLCGIVGTRRFKFDVWSYDVDLANLMESTGTPGQVHITESTHQFLGNEYEVVEGSVVQATKKIRNTVENYDIQRSAFVVKQVEHSFQVKTYFIKAPERSKSLLDDLKKVEKEAEPAKEAVSLDFAENTDLFNAEKPLPRFSGTTMALDYEGQLIHSQRGFFGRRQKGILHRDSDELSSDFEDGSVGNIPEDRGYPKKGKVRLADHRLITCMRDEKICNEYLYDIPTHPVTQSFENREHEAMYRRQCQHDLFKPEVGNKLAQPRYNGFTDLLINLVFFVFLSISTLIVFSPSVVSLPYFVVSFIILLAMCIIVSAIIIRKIPLTRCNRVEHKRALKFFSPLSRIVWQFTQWLPSNVLGAVFLSLPVGMVMVSFNCSNHSTFIDDIYFGSLVVVGIVHFLNFNLLSAWMRSLVASVFGIVFIVLVFISTCSLTYQMSDMSINSTASNISLDNNSTTVSPLSYLCLFSGFSEYRYEVALAIALLLLLIWILNRELEANNRLAFHGHLKARTEKHDMLDEKRKTDWLLANILPEHVAEQMRKSPSTMFSRSHKDIAVIFISIVNFDDFYEENFSGGIENMRVLNELFNDYEALFNKPEYKDVEKIKTIGSTFMAAAGLNEIQRAQNTDPKAHLYAMMDFCVEILDVVKRFNEGMFNFNFVLKLGYNVGDVVSGIIGNTKLHYDIWGNTVNVASRMYSVGVTSRIQVTEETAKLLEDQYEFEFRDRIEVKGKGKMKTYLLIGKKGEAGTVVDANCENS